MARYDSFEKWLQATGALKSMPAQQTTKQTTQPTNPLSALTKRSNTYQPTDIQYRNPSKSKNFRDKKKSTDGAKFDWQGALLKDMPKSMGKSYAAKFSNMMSQLGVTDTQTQENFKTWLDSKEYGAPSMGDHIMNNASQIYDREIRERQQGTAYKAQQKKKQQELEQAANTYQVPAPNSEVVEQPMRSNDTGLLPLARMLGRGVNKGVEGVNRWTSRSLNTLLGGFMEQDLKNNAEKGNNAAAEMLSKYHNDRQGSGAVLDTLYDMSGYAIGGIGAAAGLRGAGLTGNAAKALQAERLAGGASKEAIKRAALGTAGEGALIGGGQAGLESLVRQTMDEDTTATAADELKHIALGTALGGILDPLTTVGAPLLKDAAGRTLRQTVDDAARPSIDALRRAEQDPLVVMEQLRNSTGQARNAAGGQAEQTLRMLSQRGLPEVTENVNYTAPQNPTPWRGITMDEQGNRIRGLGRQQEFSNPSNARALDELATTADNTLGSTARRNEGAVIERTLPAYTSKVEEMPSPIAKRTEPEKTGIASKLRNAKDSLYRELISDTGEFKRIDDYFKTKDLERVANALPDSPEAQRLLDVLPDGSLKAGDSLHKGIRTLAVAPKRAMDVAENLYNPVFQKMKSKGINREALDEYALARHALDIHEQNAKGLVNQQEAAEMFEKALREGRPQSELLSLQNEMQNFSPYKLPSYANEDWARSVLAKYDTAEMRETHEALMQAQQQSLRNAYEGGMISESAYNHLLQYHPNYVSLARDVGKDSFKGTSGKRASSPIQSRGQGSDELLVLSPTDSAVKNAYLTAFNVEKNAAYAPIVKMAELDDMGQFFTKVEAPSPNTVTVYKDGVPQYFEVPEYMSWYVNDSSNNAFTNVSGNVLKTMSDMVKKGSTHYNVPFHFLSAVRDSMQAAFTSRTSNPVKMVENISAGFLDSFFGEALEKATKGKFKSFKADYLKQGGGATQFISTSSEDIAKFAKSIEDGTFGNNKRSIVLKPLDWLEDFGAAMERGAKLGEYRSAKKAGYDDASAFFEAMDVMDYADLGSFTRAANKYVPYIGATLRGNARIAKAFREDALGSTAKGVMMFTLPTAGIYAMRWLPTTSDTQRQELKNLQDWQKNMYWHIPSPTDDTIISIPKPHVLGQLFANPMERALDQYYEQTLKTNAEAAGKVFTDLGASLAPPTEIAGISTLLELGINKNTFTGFDIESEYDVDNAVPKREREGYNQSEIGKLLAGAINYGQEEGIVSPAQIDYTIRDLTGTVGSQALTVTDALLGDNPRERSPMDELLKPVGQFVSDPTRASGVYEPLKKLAAREKDSNKDLRGMNAIDKEIEKANRKAQNYAQEMKDINKEIAAVREDKSLSSSEKREKITELRRQQDEVGSKVIDWYNRMQLNN